jgi:hypothetical protein
MRTSILGLGAVLSVALALGTAARAGAQGANAAPLVSQSIEGSLESVDAKLNGVILKGSDGKRHAWKLPPTVIQEAARYKAGDWMWVIYRPIGSSQRAVTALGFPGSEEKPHYVNATGDPVLLRTGPMTDGVCRTVAAEQMTGHVLRRGGDVIDEAPCWCCASQGKACELANRSHDENGTGRIVLARCFP